MKTRKPLSDQKSLRRLSVFEFKYEAAPRPTKSMHIVTEDLNLKQLWVVYPGEGAYALGKHIELLPLTKIETILGQIG